jgi:hypothetical protein
MSIINPNIEYCSYFKAYMAANNLHKGDNFKGHEYINWITTRHQEFRKVNGLNQHVPYTGEQQKQFEQYIFEPI